MPPSSVSANHVTRLGRYKDNHGNGSFTPRVADSYRLEAPVSCATGNPGELRISGNEFNKYGYFREPLRDGLFSHRFENQFESPQTAPLKGEVKGNVKTAQQERETPDQWVVPRRRLGSGSRHRGLHERRVVLGHPVQALDLTEGAQVRQLEEAEAARLQADVVAAAGVPLNSP